MKPLSFKLGTLIAASLLLLAACDNQNSSTRVEAQSSALIAEQSAESAAEPETEAVDVGTAPTPEVGEATGNDAPTPTVEIAWANGDTEKNVLNTDVLSLKVTNFLDIPVSVKVVVHTAGILAETAEVDLGSVALAAQGEIFLDVQNDAIPMQTTKGVCQAYATAEVTFNNGQEDTVAITGSAPLYYRQLPNYKGMLVFGQKIFKKEYKGRFTDLLTEVQNNGLDVAKAAVLGRIKRNGKDFEDVTIDSVTAANEQDGEPVLVGMGMGSAGSYEEEEEMRHAE